VHRDLTIFHLNDSTRPRRLTSRLRSTGICSGQIESIQMYCIAANRGF
jgi:hypothetical protein